MAKPSPILCAIEELQLNELATRSWVMAGLYLGLCQRCLEWEGTGCERVTTVGGEFAEFLCDGERWCEEWAKLHAR